MKVVIIGGGISGLACAWRLKKLGVPVVLLEQEQRAGGVIRTEQRDGVLFEAGPQSFLLMPALAANCGRESPAFAVVSGVVPVELGSPVALWANS